MKQLSSDMIEIKSNCYRNHNLRTLIVSILIVVFTLVCSLLLILMIINIYNHYNQLNVNNNDYDYKHQQWLQHHHNAIKFNPVNEESIDLKKQQQFTTQSTPLITATTTRSTTSTTSSTKTNDNQHQGLMVNQQGVESYVQSVLDSTFKATQELINQRNQNNPNQVDQQQQPKQSTKPQWQQLTNN